MGAVLEAVFCTKVGAIVTNYAAMSAPLCVIESDSHSEFEAIELAKPSPKRSALMSRIRSKNTKPEIRVRSALHRLGFRFRLHAPNLPGHPDIVLPRHRLVIEVLGCFWHAHGCAKGQIPRSNRAYWLPKLIATLQRDKRNHRQLRAKGWSVVTIRECRLDRCSDIDLERLLLRHLGT
jgi:DNA mismatch endonuclease (patch repair protein)